MNRAGIGAGGYVPLAIASGTIEDRLLKGRGRSFMYNHSVTDDRAIILLNEFAKYDPKALKLMALLQAAKDFGERDQLLCQVHHYIGEQFRD